SVTVNDVDLTWHQVTSILAFWRGLKTAPYRLHVRDHYHYVLDVHANSHDANAPCWWSVGERSLSFTGNRAQPTRRLDRAGGFFFEQSACVRLRRRLRRDLAEAES